MTSVSAKDVKKVIGKYMIADGMEPIVDLKKSHGSWIVDSRDGKEYLDLFSMFASLSIGYNHPYVLENKERLLEAAINKPTNSDIYCTQLGEFIGGMGEMIQPDYLPHAFYISGGTLAVENALKTAFDWKVRKNIASGKGEKGNQIIHFEQAFHGRSGYTLSLTDSHDLRKTKYFPKFKWPRVKNPKITFPLNDESIKKIIEAEKTAVNEIKDALAKNKDDIAAIIIEPIQGEGGDNHFRDEFFKQLRILADENECLLIYDEVQTGLGITGKLWCHQHFGESGRPDILSFGKKTQVCGIYAGKRIDENEKSVFSESSRLNSTWGGNLADMIRLSLYLEVIKKEELVKNAGVQGKYLLDQLLKLQ